MQDYKNHSKRIVVTSALRVAFIYLIVGLLWIFFSDRLVYSLFDNVALIQTYKGFFFVIISSILIFILIYEGLKTVLTTSKISEFLSQTFPGVFITLNEHLELKSINEQAKIILKFQDADLEKKIVETDAFEIMNLELKNAIKQIKQGESNIQIDINLFINNQRRNYQFLINPISLDQKQAGRVIIYGFDNTDKYDAEQLIKENEKKYFELFNNAGIGMAIASKEGRLIEINEKAASNFGLQKENLLGKTPQDFLPKTSIKYYNEIIIEILVHQTTIVKEEENYSQHCFLTTYHPIFNEAKEIKYIQVISIDITSEKDAKKALIELNKELESIVNERTQSLVEANNALEFKSEQLSKLNMELKQSNSKLFKANDDLNSFAHSISHDLRAPLRSINGFSEIFIDKYGKHLDQEGNRLIGKIINNSKKMSALIEDLLSFSKYGSQQLNPFPTDLDKLVDSILKEFEERPDSKEFTINKTDLGKAFCDKILLKQVWINLIDNAIKYSRNSELKKIDIGSTVIDDKIVYFVADYGAGFDMNYANKLFKVFQRLHRDDEFEGTGVGLAIAEKIISRHGGRIWAESEMGKMTTFYFTL